MQEVESLFCFDAKGKSASGPGEQLATVSANWSQVVALPVAHRRNRKYWSAGRLAGKCLTHPLAPSLDSISPILLALGKQAHITSTIYQYEQAFPSASHSGMWLSQTARCGAELATSESGPQRNDARKATLAQSAGDNAVYVRVVRTASKEHY